MNEDSICDFVGWALPTVFDANGGQCLPYGRVLGSMLAAVLLFVAGCNVGPNYKQPNQSLTQGYRSATTQEATTQPALSREWWRLFGDPTLNTLEASAVENNPNLKAAVARVDQARAAARVIRADFFPTISLSPSIDRARSGGGRGGSTVIGTNSGGTGTSTGTGSGIGTGTGTGTGTSTGTGSSTVTGTGVSSGNTITSVRVPFDLDYELDVWGKIRRNYESANATANSSAADYQVVLQTLESDVATDYFAIRALIDQENILKRTVESYRQSLGLVQSQLKAGLVGQTDLSQAQAELDSTLTQQLETERQRADLEHALAILLGRPPSELALQTTPLDMEPPIVPAGMPAELLRRRPDVAEAEQNLVAANAQVGVATALFYPDFNLSGSAGFEAFNTSHVFDWENRVWSIGASFTQPIFEGGRLKANLEQAKARYAELAATYRNSVLSAVRDVEDALTDLHFRAQQAEAQNRAVRESREYVRLSTLQYKQGLASYLLVIDAERTLLNNELSASQILNNRLSSTVLLIRALGGGWDGTYTPTTQQAER